MIYLTAYNTIISRPAMPCSPVNLNRLHVSIFRVEETNIKQAANVALKLEAVDLRRTTRRGVAEDRTVHGNRCVKQITRLFDLFVSFLLHDFHLNRAG